MATESTFVWDKSFTAAESLASAQFYIVSSSAANNVAICIASSGITTVVTRAYGVVQNNPTSGNAATVRVLGTSKVVASSSGTIAVGAFVGSSTWGTALTATTGYWCIGRAMTASSGVTGQIIEVDLTGPFMYIAGATA
jgi:hypothetical protein